MLVTKNIFKKSTQFNQALVLEYCILAPPTGKKCYQAFSMAWKNSA
jgi:hypothetical protein